MREPNILGFRSKFNMPSPLYSQLEHYTSMLDSNQIKYSGETISNLNTYSGEIPPVAINYLVSLDTVYNVVG